MLRDPAVEMISISAPNHLHAPITIDAARAGKHVVCEKPLCLTLEEADAMIDACRKCRRPPALRRGALLRAEIREGEADGGRGRVRTRSPRQAEREAQRPARRTGSGMSSNRAAARSWTWDATASRFAGGSWASLT
jgi:hypothetical protein